MTNADREQRPFVVVGGGIGGLSTALALARAGRHVEVLEQADTFREVGAGLQIGPNAFRVFERLGVVGEVSRLATFPESLLVRDALTGDTIVDLPVGENFRRRFGHPYGLMHRADLHRVLLDACRGRPEISLRTGTRLASFEETGDGVAVRLEGGESRHGVGLVGADGLWSAVRREIVADGEPRLAGHVCYRAIVPIEAVPEALRRHAMGLWVGPKIHLVLWPMRGDRFYNVTAVFHSDRFEDGWDTWGDPTELHERFDRTRPEIRELLASIPDWRMFVMRDREPVRTWSRGRATLLGDAAHPMLQYLAQGACMAMEDAVCLADAVVHRGDDVPRAFLEYQDARYLRTTRVQLTARLYGHVYHAAGATADLRDAFLRSRTAEQTLESMAWIFDPS